MAAQSVLLTDLYELTMLEAYRAEGMKGCATFEFFVRAMPAGRGFLVAAGLAQLVDYLTTLRLDPDDLAWLAASGRFDTGFVDSLSDLAFTGDVDAMPEGTVFFADEPIVRVTAPLREAQLVESRAILDDGGFPGITIFASGNLDELRLRDLVRAKAPIDGFGVGTRVDTSADAPYLDCGYKLQEYEGVPRRKRSAAKATWPGRKQVYRQCDADGRLQGDVVTLADEAADGTWPAHCVQGTTGAEFVPGLRFCPGALLVSKGTDPHAEAYSGFKGTALADALRARHVRRLFIGGLATDIGPR